MKGLAKRVEKLEADQGASSLHVFALYGNGVCEHLESGKRFANEEEAAASRASEGLIIFVRRFSKAQPA